ncbi:uncharacterized protein N7518_000962 [Penicillium psychrosexuale]|uniref:uncharacterized protein n=1 Tax=Penicillium psychrosexuale TaxID=1002107 RepID=UPI0025459A1E|nr:uncharacterized protein N7518_000962 [Penicillium psychrosexuale]KAJ5804659.1 hypothetical protein N7518_000962 [Penicillium psychrosexuale]
MADFLAKTEVSKADIITVQEPWENPYNDTIYHLLKQMYELLFPSSTEIGGRVRVCIYISKKLAGWMYYAHSEFCQEVRLQAGLGEICFFNIYNECGTTGTVNLLNDLLIELCDEADLDLWLEPGAIMRDQNGKQITIDLFFGTPDLTKRLVVCKLALECHTDLDHLPILDHLIDIVRRGIHESTLWARSSPYANLSWTKECGEAVKHSRHMFRQYLAIHSKEDWETYRLARN